MYNQGNSTGNFAVRGRPAGTMEETYMEENRSLEPETLGPTAPGEENAPAAGAPEKRNLPGKKLVILAAAALAVIAAAAVLLSRGSASSVAKRYCKAIFEDQKTVVALTVYDWKQYQIRSNDYEDEEEYFEYASDRWDEDIRSWNDFYQVRNAGMKEDMEDLYGDYRLTVEATKSRDLSVKRLLSDQDYWLDVLEKYGAFDRDSVTAAQQVTVKVKIKGEEDTDRVTYKVTLVKAGGGWKVLDYEGDYD